MLRNKFIVILLLQLSRSDNEEPNSMCICNYTLQVERNLYICRRNVTLESDGYIFFYFFLKGAIRTNSKDTSKKKTYRWIRDHFYKETN